MSDDNSEKLLQQLAAKLNDDSVDKAKLLSLLKQAGIRTPDDEQAHSTAFANEVSDELPDDVKQALEELLQADVKTLLAIKLQDIIYLIDRCPFLQLVGDGEAQPLEAVQILEARSSWRILNYGDALSSSPGFFIYGGGDFRIGVKDDGDGSDGVVNPGKGTIVKQAFDTAQEMIEAALTLGWQGIKMVDGHPSMAWAAWMKCEDKGITLQGYEPDEEARKKRQRIVRADQEDFRLLQANRVR